MSYTNAKRNYETEQFEVSAAPALSCRDCHSPTTFENMSNYGMRCWRCHQHWCRSAPKPEPQNGYVGDPKGWAKRIIEKSEKGLPVSGISLKFAKEALGARHDV